MSEAMAASTTVEERLDVLSAHVDELVTEMRRQREVREQWAELAQEMAPVARSAMELASTELEDLSADVTVDDAVALARTTVRSLPKLHSLLLQLGSLTDLGTELTSLAGAGMSSVSDTLAVAEERGYFVVARHGARMVDRVVSSLDEPDLDAFGESLDAIVATLKQLAQPGPTALLRRSGSALAHLDDDAAAPPPSAFDLVRQLRDPQLRRGLGRLLTVLRAVGEPAPHRSVPPSTRSGEHTERKASHAGHDHQRA